MIKEKSNLRTHMRALRSTKEQDVTVGQQVIDRLVESEAYINAKRIFCYIGTYGEVQTKTFIACALLQNKAVFVPKCNKDSTMLLVRIRSFLELAPGKYGILEPINTKETANPQDIDLAIIPGLAFDRSGNRLGQGKGYYDRFLAEFTGCAAGICFERDLQEHIPKGVHDKPVTLLFTEKNTYH